jgi:hypothetical protein
VPNTGPLVGSLVSSGTTIYASTCYFPSFCKKVQYLSSPDDYGHSWTVMPNEAPPQTVEAWVATDRWSSIWSA